MTDSNPPAPALDADARDALVEAGLLQDDHWESRLIAQLDALPADFLVDLAIKRGGPVPTLDVIAHLLQRHVPRADVRKWFVVGGAEYQVIDMPDEQAELLYQADAALAERRHRD